MEILIRELTRPEQPALLAHFLALDGNDRRLRFGAALSERALRHYVERIDFDHDAVFGVGDEELKLLGVAHVARSGGHAELGISVLEGARSRGIGGAPPPRGPPPAPQPGVRAPFLPCPAAKAGVNGAFPRPRPATGAAAPGDGPPA